MNKRIISILMTAMVSLSLLACGSNNAGESKTIPNITEAETTSTAAEAEEISTTVEAEKLQQEWAEQRLEAEKEAKEYNSLCSQKEQFVNDLNNCLAEQDRLYKYMSSVEDEYQRAEKGALQMRAHNRKPRCKTAHRLSQNIGISGA